MKMLVCFIALACLLIFSGKIRAFVRPSAAAVTVVSPESAPSEVNEQSVWVPNIPAEADLPPAALAPSDTRVIASQRMAVVQYPTLAVEGEPMQHAFVQEYKRMRAKKDPRLQNPDWPMQLAKRVAEAK
jgi:hypothetical protein